MTQGATPHERPRRLFEEDPHLAPASGPASKLVVACILDEFSFQCFSPEAEFVPLTPDNWLVELSATQPDLLLVESAWRGHRGTWWNTVSRLDGNLRGILAWCRERGIPTAFWNKEDPVHFATFLSVAAQFDHVFTTDMDCVPRYKSRLGHDQVSFLPFAAQPRLHNPLGSFERMEGAAFAGAYYRRYADRARDLDELAAALRSRMPFRIYDRNYGQEATEYAFPATFAGEVVGGLKPDEIAEAYKGYDIAVNLNSVKQSQSMFARRVFEVLASDTVLVSNFSRGLRMMFGDLVLSTDQGAELVRRLDDYSAVDNFVPRLRLHGLRKTMSEHTYGERISFIARSCGIPLEAEESPRVLVLAPVESESDVEAVREAVARQSYSATHVVFVTRSPGMSATAGHASASESWLHSDDLRGLQELLDEPVEGLVTVFNPADFHGRSYLADMVQVLGWASAACAGKSTFYRAEDERVIEHAGDRPYRPTQGIALRRGVARTSTMPPLTEFADIAEVMRLGLDGLSVDPFNYCQNGAGLPAGALEHILDLDVFEGIPLAEIRAHAGRASAVADLESGLALGPLLESMPAAVEGIALERADDLHQLVSTLPDGKHHYIYTADVLPVTLLGSAPTGTVFLECDPGLDVMLTLVFYAAQGVRLGHVMAGNLRNQTYTVPEGTVSFKVGLRVSGPGTTTIRRIIPREHHELSSGVMTTSRKVVMTNVYPSYRDLYRNGFVHTRVKAYRDHGQRLEVILPRNVARPVFREFAGVDVVELSPRMIAAMCSGGEVDAALVHFLDRTMWEALTGWNSLERVCVWVHGAEVQPWWRREYNYADDGELEAAKLASEERLAFWRHAFSHLPDNVHFVFVSQYFADEVFEDVGVRLPEDRYSIIHNPIDTSLFAYQPKPAEQSRRVLTIRPYASRKYANDLSVEAVRLLSARDGFDRLRFCFVGDGPLFDETVAPLRGLPNVEIRQEFLTHDQIAALHKDYGIFLTPTRMDAQGVSRDEAMASGLVPVTSAVAAVPEFVDESCGFLAEAEDATGLADAIWVLSQDDAKFAAMSRAAADRVKAQTSADVVIPVELALFR